ncbi:MAG: DUF308 domain-containing protein [Muribaculaceae bacterium]|nr:DUF308 domain-containing protein [Muribaculaceae bacterium]
MKTLNATGSSRLWWLLLAVGILFIIGGFAYWFWPVAGYAVTSVLFGWMLVAVGAVQLCVSTGANRPKGRGWWIAGGIINLVIGFMLVGNVFLAEAVLPYFMAIIFFYAGVMTFASGFIHRGSLRWLHIVNGVLLLIIAGIFCFGGITRAIAMVSFMAAFAFIYWGFVLSSLAIDLKPRIADRR